MRVTDVYAAAICAGVDEYWPSSWSLSTLLRVERGAAAAAADDDCVDGADVVAVELIVAYASAANLIKSVSNFVMSP